MPDIPNRNELEARMARLLGKLTRAQMGRLLEELGDPPRVENVSPTFWDDAGKELRDAIRPFMERVYLESAQRLMTEQPVGVSWELVNERAADWSSTYTFDLVRGIDEVTRRHLQNSINRYYRDAQTMEELVTHIGQMYGPVRAEMVAITEVTNASTAGERMVADEVAVAGIELEPIFQTSNDDRVCPICAPRHGKPITDGQYPALHPR